MVINSSGDILACYMQVLFMDAAQTSPNKVAEFIDVMTEKEMRVRTPHEELRLLFKASVGKLSSPST